MFSKFYIHIIASTAFVLFNSLSLSAQISLKFESAGGPAGSGPSTTPQAVTFYYGDAGVFSPATTVTYSISNQQFASVEGNPTIPGFNFGANVAMTNTIAALSYYPLMSAVGSPLSSYYSTNGATPAINIANDYAIEMMTIADALINDQSVSTYPITAGSDVYFADLTLTFNRPVSNPVLHFTGLGGNTAANDATITYILGYSTKLQITSGQTISKLAGNAYFNVSGSTINNSATYFGPNSQGSLLSSIPNSTCYAASGSVLVTGTNITTLTFKVSLTPDGGRELITATGVSTNGPLSPQWSIGLNDPVYTAEIASGDGFTLGVTLAAFTISGNVFDDANGLTDATVNGTGTNAGGLNAVLVDANTGLVVAVVPVSAAGDYTFSNAASSGTYYVKITTAAATVGSAPPASTLPANWAYTGENIGTTAGNDGTPNGTLSPIAVTANVSNANFGIDQLPNTNNVSQTIGYPIGSAITAGKITTATTGTDPEDGALSNGTITITSLPTNGVMYYNGVAVTSGQTIASFNPALLSYTGLQAGTVSTSFGYAYKDAAGKQDPTPGTYTVNWATPLPIVFGTIEAAIIGEDLVVSWTTLKEINADHFDIEVSKDGANFTKAGTVVTKATNGNSDITLSYKYSISATNAASFASVSLLILGLLSLLFFRRNKNLISAMFIVAIGTGIIGLSSCKKSDKVAVDSKTKIFVRVVEVDKDGTKAYSKILQTIKE
jgi:hypothetical protein